MALRHLGRGLVMRAKDALPTRGGGGGPIKYAPELRQTMPLWDELWWDDGQFHSQATLDGVGDNPLHTPASSLRQLGVALAFVGSTIWAAHAAWSPEKEPYAPQQYPPEVLEAITSRKKVQWTRAP